MQKKTFTGTVGRTMAETKYKYHTVDTDPKNAPNVVYILLDDMGFAQLGCYGSTIETPNIDRLAKEGLRYNNFHTTAVCSATRTSRSSHFSCICHLEQCILHIMHRRNILTVIKESLMQAGM